MRQELIEELDKATVEEIVGVITFDFSEEKRNLLIDKLVEDFVNSHNYVTHKNQGTLSLETE